MAKIFKSELHQAQIRRSGNDLEALLHALEADGSISVEDDPEPETQEVTNEDTGETETVETPYAPGPEIVVQVDADDKAVKEAEAEAEKAAKEAEKEEKAAR